MNNNSPLRPSALSQHVVLIIF